MDKMGLPIIEWRNTNIQVFWGEIAPLDHVVQFYEEDQHFLNTLEGFVGSGFLLGESVIVIAKAEHLEALNERLKRQNFDLDMLINKHRYFPLDANETLSKFMVNNWPDRELFEKYISSIIGVASKDNKKVRAFGEMVAVLWAQGLNGATVQLEFLWHNLHKTKAFCLYCAYPRSGFTQCKNESVDSICNIHSKIIAGHNHPSTEIYYKSGK